jgi:hypothetical protein
MEQFFVATKHSGAIEHVHSFLFPPSAVAGLREIRLTVTALALAWVTVKAMQHFAPNKTSRQ